MMCPNCSGQNVSIELSHSGARTAKHGTGFGGNMNNAARGLTALSTLGISNLVWKKSKGTEKTKLKSRKVAICQDCGNDWNLR